MGDNETKSVLFTTRKALTHLGMTVSVLCAALSIARTPALVVNLLLEGSEGGGGTGPGPSPCSKTPALAHRHQRGEALGHKHR